MSYASKTRLDLFKEQIQSKGITSLASLSDTELLEILDASVVPNALDAKAVRYGYLFHLIFLEREKEKTFFIEQINKLTNLALNLTKTEKMIIKFGILKGFKTKSWKIELHRYLSNPIFREKGRKIISSTKFKEIFYFAHNLVKRGKNNEQFPRY